MYDAAVEGEKRPFPKRILFTGWFDTGKQGKEWPGSFEIAQKEGYFWRAAKSVPHPKLKDKAWIQVGLRGDRPTSGADARLFFRYKIEGADRMDIVIDSPENTVLTIGEIELKKGAWSQKDLLVRNVNPIRKIEFLVPAGATLWIDDLLLYEPAFKK